MPVNNRAPYLHKATRRICGAHIRKFEKIVNEGGELTVEQVGKLRDFHAVLTVASKAEDAALDAESRRLKDLSDDEINKRAAQGNPGGPNPSRKRDSGE